MRNAKGDTIAVLRYATIVLGVLIIFAGRAQAQNPGQEDFAGIYVGVFAGYADGSYVSETSPEIDHEPTGEFLGIRAGWSRPYGSWLFGIDADTAFTSIDGEDTITVSGFKSDVSHDINYLSTLRARVGGRAGPAMIYATAGFALADLDNQIVVTAGAQEVGHDEESSRHTGWAAGAGVELPLTQRISVTAEYLYVDMGEEEVTVEIGDFPFTDKADLNLSTLRLSVNLRF